MSSSVASTMCTTYYVQETMPIKSLLARKKCWIQKWKARKFIELNLIAS